MRRSGESPLLRLWNYDSRASARWEVEILPKERIEDIIEKMGTPIAEKLGCELVDVEYRKEGADWVLRCSIDCASGVGVDECERFSEALGKALDAEDPIPGSYLLEVSSPGLERPLKKDNDFVRFTGNKIKVKLHQALNGQKVFQGDLLGLAGEDSEKVLKIGINNSVMEIPRKMIAKAHLVSEIFGAGGGKKGK